jgi:hypothetical protein
MKSHRRPQTRLRPGLEALDARLVPSTLHFVQAPNGDIVSVGPFIPGGSWPVGTYTPTTAIAKGLHGRFGGAPHFSLAAHTIHRPSLLGASSFGSLGVTFADSTSLASSGFGTHVTYATPIWSFNPKSMIGG